MSLKHPSGLSRIRPPTSASCDGAETYTPARVTQRPRVPASRRHRSHRHVSSRTHLATVPRIPPAGGAPRASSRACVCRLAVHRADIRWGDNGSAPHPHAPHSGLVRSLPAVAEDIPMGERVYDCPTLPKSSRASGLRAAPNVLVAVPLSPPSGLMTRRRSHDRSRLRCLDD